jgi:hypothetical protein
VTIPDFQHEPEGQSSDEADGAFGEDSEAVAQDDSVNPDSTETPEECPPAKGSLSRDAFLQMPEEEIAASIIGLLQDRNQTSCRKAGVAAQVLKRLGVLTRGQPRTQCEQAILRVLRQLRYRKIIEEYKTGKNLRVRLMADYHERFEKYRTGTRRRALPPRLSASHAEHEEGYTGHSLFDAVDIPELPARDQDPLDVLAGDSTDERQLSEDTHQEGERITPARERRNILAVLNATFGKIEGAQCELGFRELLLTVPLTAGTRSTLSVGYYGGGYTRLSVSSRLPFSAGAIMELLSRCARPDFEGRVCVETRSGAPQFLIKREFDLSKCSDEDIMAVVDDIIRESRELAEVIESHHDDATCK